MAKHSMKLAEIAGGGVLITVYRNSEGYYDPTAGAAIQNIERTAKNMNEIKRGDIFYIERYSTVGSEQRPGRPAIIVSNNKNNQYADTYEVVYLTTQPKNELPTHVVIRGTGRESIALCEQITTVSISCIGNRICAINASEMAQIDIALLISLDLQLGAPEKSKTAPAPKPESAPLAHSGYQPKANPDSTARKSAPPTGTIAAPLKPAETVVVAEDPRIETLTMENVALKAQLDIYKGLHQQMLDRVMGVTA